MESSYVDRSDYFKMIAHLNKKIAHDQPLSVGSDKKRMSFHRVNDEDELNTACVNYAHFPCVVHIDHIMHFRSNGTGLPNRVSTNVLLFLKDVDMQATKRLANEIENAYGYAEEAMNIFISFLVHDSEESGSCGELFLFDANKMSAIMAGPINDKLFGWLLTFDDENVAKDLKYDANNFYEPDEE